MAPLHSLAQSFCQPHQQRSLVGHQHHVCKALTGGEEHTRALCTGCTPSHVILQQLSPRSQLQISGVKSQGNPSLPQKLIWELPWWLQSLHFTLALPPGLRCVGCCLRAPMGIPQTITHLPKPQEFRKEQTWYFWLLADWQSVQVHIVAPTFKSHQRQTQRLGRPHLPLWPQSARATGDQTGTSQCPEVIAEVRKRTRNSQLSNLMQTSAAPIPSAIFP